MRSTTPGREAELNLHVAARVQGGDDAGIELQVAACVERECDACLAGVDRPAYPIAQKGEIGRTAFQRSIACSKKSSDSGGEPLRKAFVRSIFWHGITINMFHPGEGRAFTARFYQMTKCCFVPGCDDFDATVL